jgi:hypothetical protein
MTPIEDYIKLPKQERQAHLRLSEPCCERGGKSEHYRGLLAHIFNTTMPQGLGIQLCHACHNAKCGNPNHLYWGTASENRLDDIANGGHLTPYDIVIAKHGLEEAARKRQAASLGNKNGAGNAGGTKSEEHKAKIAESVRNSHARRRGK